MKTPHNRIMSYIVLSSSVLFGVSSLAVTTTAAVGQAFAQDSVALATTSSDTTATASATPTSSATPDDNADGTGEHESETHHTQFMTDLQQAKATRDAAITKAKDDFAAKVALIKDAKKQEVANNLMNVFNQVNDARTDAYSQHLDTLDDILDRLQARINTAKTNGDDVSAIQTKIDAERTKIANERTKVKAQQEKAYTVTITSTTAPYTDFQKVFTQLKADLTTIKTDIKTIKQDIIGIYKMIKALKHDTDATASPSPTPTDTTTPTSSPTATATP